MGEMSFPWPDSTVDYDPQIGDGRKITAEEYAGYFGAVYGAGVLLKDNQLMVTSPGANQISVNTGWAIVGGRLYHNDAALALTPASAGGGSTRKDSVILQCDWTGGGDTAQYTVRAVVKQGTSGAVPSLTQTPNVLWEEYLYHYTINDAGAISGITDARTFATYNTVVDKDNLAASVAGDGLSGGDGSALEVNVDNATIEISADTLQVKDGGIGAGQLAAAVAGNGLSGGAGNALAVNVDNSTIEISSDALRVKDAGITTDKINALAVSTGKIANLAVTTSKLADAAVTEEKIYALNVTSSKIANGAVGPTKLADAAVETAKIKDDNVTVDKLAHSMNAQPIGFNADSVDGYHAADIIASGLFVGMIMPFYGTLGGSDGHRPVVGGVAKEDWHLCNGDLVGAIQTPDMAGRTAVGVGGDLGEDLGDVGGAATVNLAHSHSDGTLAAANHQHGVSPTYTSTMQAGTPTIAPPETGGAYSVPTNTHFHNLEFNSTSNANADVTGNTGSSLSSTQSVMNPYVALYWIMKVA